MISYDIENAPVDVALPENGRYRNTLKMAMFMGIMMINTWM
jgi:hypothetical protein